MQAVGSRDYWKDPTSFPEDWQSRAQQAARFIHPGWTVLDLGSGPHMALRKYLPKGAAYVPADLHQWTSEVRGVDVDANVFPPDRIDCVIMLGVLEYLTYPENAFRYARSSCSGMIVSYCHPLTPDNSTRAASGWVNAYSVPDLEHLAGAQGWLICSSETFRMSHLTHQMIHFLHPSDQ